MLRFTRRQWLTLIVIGVADFCNAICVSLQAPFYPQIAESKNCTATEYGLVFGIFEFTVFLISPFYGQHLHKLGPKLVFNAGIYTTGICAILFGLLDKIQERTPFIVLSFTIRIVEALGNAAFLTASFAIIAQEFPNNVATTFACLETFFGLGLIFGPTVGGALFQVGGYTLPFAVMGSALFLSAVLTAFVLPKHESGKDRKVAPSAFQALKITGVLLCTLSIVATSMSIGFLQATLEPHLRTFDLPPVLLGLMFVLNGGTYALTAPAFGWCCDKTYAPKWVTVAGCLLIATGFTMVGPAPFLPVEKKMWMIMFGLVLHGLGMSAQLVASFTDALRTLVLHGFPNDLETFGLISGIWTSAFALGAFVGPSISGVLFDNIGFANASLFVILLHVAVAALTAAFVLITKDRTPVVKFQDAETAVGDPSEKCPADDSITESLKNIRSVGNGISIEKSRPPGMNSLIACNSYKSQAWPERDSSYQRLGPFSYTYGAVNHK
ncbi:unnamed protein product [Phyllotreta striolata]|uniref:Major facilitator superfamily (MFS) profile domain-containing protein n=1 Tax=Phyllotreta striolata TaxID=444603 RepID=A0A9N9TSV0_PHYSR|nr:unnamed protein product [Phyllotreta striolata]